MPAYQPYTLSDLGKGLNRFHSLDGVPEGMMFELKNMDPLSNGQLITRKGHERYYGSLPLRANSMTKVGTTYTIEFDSSLSIDVSQSKSGPLVVAGDLPSDAGTFTGDFSDSFSSHYYDDFTVTFRETFPSGSPATVTKSASATGVSQENLFIGWHESDSLSDLSNTLLVPEDVIITKSSYSVDLVYTSPSSISGYFGYLEVPATGGLVHIETFTSETTVSIPAASHGLANSRFIIRCYEDDGTYLTSVTPSEITINAATDITINFDTAVTGRAIIYAADNEHSEGVSAGPQTISITGVDDPLNFWELWITSGGTRTNVTPGSIVWDAATSTVTIDYVAPTGGESVEAYWVPANYSANAISFEGTDGGSDFTTTEPEISVWGIEHDNIYRSSAPKGGFTHHLDNYKSELTEKMITALGGNLMQATSFATGGTTYKMASLTLRGSNRVSGDHVLAPLFSTVGPGYTRTRGNVEDTSIDADGYAQVTAVSYVSNGVADYTLTFDSDMTGTISLGTEISTNDCLTVRNCANSRNNGTFSITSVSIATNVVTFRVTNTACIDDSQDESGISGQANVFTDEILLTAAPEFIVGDSVSSSEINGKIIHAVDVSAGNYMYFSGITSNTTVSDGINLYITRTSSVLSLQNFPNESVGDDTDGGFVNGDSLTISGVTNNPKIIYINTNTTQSVSISVSSGTATVTLADHNLNVGQKVLFVASDNLDFEGEFTVLSVPSTSTFTVSTDAADGAVSATLIGKTIEIDEELELTSGPTQISVTSQGRWTIVENPKSTQSKVPETKQQHWDESAFTDQPYLRSVVVNDSMFFVNDTDEVKKFDGSTLVNAGLQPWQGWFFASVDSATTSLPSGLSLGWDNGGSNPNTDGYFVIDTPIIQVGQRFKASASGEIYTVALIEQDDASEYKVYVDEDISASDNTSTGTITKSNLYRYYVRLNAVDANRNIIASASLGADDMYVETFTSSAIDLKCGGLPPFKELDHDRIELEIYRTKRNTLGTFYRVHRRLLDYSDLGGYISFKDTKTDDLLTFALLDPTVAGLLGGELGNQWNQPPLASTVTTVDNRLVLANIKSPPTLDITFRNNGTTAILNAADFSGGEVQFQKSGTLVGAEDFNNSVVFSFEDTVAAKNQLTPASHITISSNQIDIDNTVAHGLAIGDWVYLFHSARGEDNKLDFAGWYRVSAVSGTQFSIALDHNRSAGSGDVDDVDRWISSSSSTFNAGERVPVWIGEDGNLNQVYENSAGMETRVSTRLGLAINAVMSADNPSNGYWSSGSPEPWLLSQSGQSFDTGSLKVQMVDAPSDTVNTQHSGISSDVDVFINNLLVAASTAASSEIRLFNSRLAVSYPNFPEIFDNPFEDAGTSDSVIDVNPADGQEITAAIPFFGQSVFGSANLTQVVVVFKTSSIYLVNVSTGQIQKLQSQGQGCTAPRSPAVDKDGIVFANESGVYRLGWDMKVSWVGRMISNLWTEDLDLDDISEFAGHNYKQGRQYKLSVVTSGNNYPSNVLTYDHTREEAGQPGAWGEYTNHAATGWANQSKNAFFGSQTGTVMQIRNTGELSDYRDDDQPIATQSVITGGIHYGLPGNRKTTNAVSIQYQNSSTLTDVSMSTEQSLSGTFRSSQQVDIANEHQIIRYSLAERKGTFLRVNVAKSGTKDEKMQISKITFHTRDIGTSGIREAKNFE